MEINTSLLLDRNLALEAEGVRINKDDAYTHSVVMRSETSTIRYINAKHNLNIKKYKSYFKYQ